MMGTVLSFLLLVAWMGNESLRIPAAPLPCPRAQESKDAAALAAERIEIRKDGGPGHGADQPYRTREVGAQDLERFVGGKQVVFLAPYDVFLAILLIVLIVVLIIVL